MVRVNEQQAVSQPLSVTKCDQRQKYLTIRDPTTWSKAFFQEGRDCDAMENGVSESFNYAIRHARRRHIITMLEKIRLFVMEMIYTQRVEGME
uniref:Uncharacterized protein n=1 Tax=Lactuca sativa TaxID=4236 RepID=A0A9R1XM06_LACSA|nr:hypothetical protein LSAT_V11C200056150 [Lactuca sativa]